MALILSPSILYNSYNQLLLSSAWPCMMLDVVTAFEYDWMSDDIIVRIGSRPRLIHMRSHNHTRTVTFIVISQTRVRHIKSLKIQDYADLKKTDRSPPPHSLF
ncbi:hypothetical protein BJV74DRAFT_177452 [Russula compacta]|nr:hypothetical protein BJV74DRAFT_177452 [Russula compacta]